MRIDTLLVGDTEPSLQAPGVVEHSVEAGARVAAWDGGEGARVNRGSWTVRPLGADKTLTEIWHFRLKGAPEPIYRRSLAYYNLVNSPATMINADDLENFWKCQQGLSSEAGDWVSFHRHYGRDIQKEGYIETGPNMGTSEAPMRNQMKAWSKYMTQD